MAIQPINLGNYANDGTGDDLRTAFTKVNANFTELYQGAAISTASNSGAGVGVFKDKNGTILRFKSLTSTDSSVTFTNNADTVNLRANTKLENDLTPRLGGNLDINGRLIFGTGVSDVQANVWGTNLRQLSATVQLMLESGNVNVNMGTFTNPTGFQNANNYPSGYTLDMGNWTLGTDISNNQLNFGAF